ncbi:MAG: flippase-like domain-containing protein [Deltaproteobacteria bacterium]|nr:flippase-like domain-containing protein [Deltaproteobacteria bacterium]
MKKFLFKALPWIITVGALYLAFAGVNWQELLSHVRDCDPLLISGVVLLTGLSYLLRAHRWKYFFPTPCLSYLNATRVLILGFFMNNILPARAGELVRAHVGAKLTGQKRTLILATIASERLVDGLTISLMFVGFALGLGNADMSIELLYVAMAFGLVAVGVVAAVAMRKPLFAAAQRLGERLNHRAGYYAVNRFEVFIDGLSPLTKTSRLPGIVFFSILIWFIELGVYYLVTRAYGVDLSVAACVFFLVAVNFSSLIPSAPGAFGVIEFVAKAALVSLGVNGELALAMVITQHLIQYLVVGVPGLFVMLTLQHQIGQLCPHNHENAND